MQTAACNSFHPIEARAARWLLTAQHRGLITTRRGTIAVVDRDGLKAMSCECYDRVEQFFGDIVGDSGSGRAD